MRLYSAETVVHIGEGFLIEYYDNRDEIFTITDPEVRIFKTDLTTPEEVLVVTPANSAITPTGNKVYYVWDTSLMEPGKYLAYLIYEDGISKKIIEIPLSLKSLGVI